MSDIFLTALQSAFSDAMKTALAAETAQWHVQHSKNMDELATKVQALETKIQNLAFPTTTAGHLGDEQLDTIAQHLSDMQLVTIAAHIDTAQLAGELTDSQLNDIASDIDLADLAGEFDTDKLADNIDLDEKLKEFLENNTFSIRT
jgi:outer membrane murein-binding lipoprotein Lpp